MRWLSGRAGVFVGVVVLLSHCGPDRGPGPVGTAELRAALVDTILARTARRAAFSQPKHRALGYVPDGLWPSFTDGLEAWGAPDPPDPATAPIRVLPDYGGGATGYFVADVAMEGAAGAVAGTGTGGAPEASPRAPGTGAESRIAVGDRIATVNGMAMAGFEEAAWPYIRHSTVAGFRWKLAEALPLRTALFPPGLLGDSLVLGLVGADGTERTVSLPYQPPGELAWRGASEPDYPGFALQWSTPTFNLWLPTDDRRLVLLQWHRFESSSLVDDVDRLLAQAGAEGLLDHAVIFDATRSGGGSLGAYAVQRIQPRPFKTTFGTVRVSDVIPLFVEEKEAEFREEQVFDSGGPETVDDGTWLMEWIRTDLTEAVARGDSVTEPVPFKLAHAPKDSDGVLEPAPVTAGNAGRYHALLFEAALRHLDSMGFAVEG